MSAADKGLRAQSQVPPRKRGMPGRPGFGGPGPRIGVPAEKTRDFKGSLKRLAGQLRPELGIITIVVIFSIASVAFTISGPKMLGKATNEVFRGISGKQIGKLLPGATKEQAASALRAQGNDNLASMLESMDVVPGEGIDFSRLHRTLGFVALIYAFATLFGWAQNYCMAGVAQRVVYSLRKQVDEKLDRLPLKYFDDNPRGDILSRVTNDIDNIAQTLQQSLTQIITSVLMIVGVLAQMFSISPLLAGISLLVIPISMIVTSAIAKRSQKQFTAQWERTGRLNGNIEEMHSGHSIVKVFGRQREAIEVFNQQNQELFDSSFHAQFISGLIQPSMNFINNLNYVMIAVIGGMRVANGGLSLGSVQAFIQYSKQFQQPIMQTASIANILQSTIASAERVFELLDESEEVPDPADPVRLEGVAGHVMLDNVSFRYDPDTPLIRDLSLEARPGATIAIVGPTGAGKTTLVNLLMRFYEIDSGSITIDGIDIRNMTRDDLRRTFGMVLQDTWLFGGTIKENIAYGRDDATDEDVRVAATAAHVDHFVRTLPDGYNTPLTDDATNISAGERQLLTIARAFLADPEILILDEATSSVDTRTEVLIQRAMAELMKGRTSFVIAHRLSTIRDADTIIVVNDGCIVEQGTHKGLLGAKGFYSGLYNSQFADAQFAGDGFADAQFAGAQFASTAKK